MEMTFSGGAPPAVDLLTETEVLYREIAGELALAMRGVRQGNLTEAKAAAQAVKDLRAAFQMVMDERTRVEKLRKQVAGVVGTGELDFDAARALRSGAAWLASATPEQVDEFLSGLGDGALLALPWIFEFWALPHQLPPAGAWKS